MINCEWYLSTGLCENFEEVRVKTPTWIYNMMRLTMNLTGIYLEIQIPTENMRV